MSRVTITIDEKDLPTVLEMLRAKRIAIAQTEPEPLVGGQVGEKDMPPVGRDVGGVVGRADDLRD